MAYYLKSLLIVFMVIHQLKSDIILNVLQNVRGFGMDNGGCNQEPGSKPDQGSTPDQESTPNRESTPDQGSTPAQGSTPNRESTPDQVSTPAQRSSTDQGSTPAQGSTTDQGSTPDQVSTPDQGSTPNQESTPNQGSTPGQETATTTEGTTLDYCTALNQQVETSMIVTVPAPYDKYKFINFLADQYDAKCICTLRNGTLLNTPPADLMSFVRVLNQNNIQGLMWVDTTKVNGTLIWASGQDVNSTQIYDFLGDCGAFNPDTTGVLQFVTLPCDDEYYFLCQFN